MDRKLNLWILLSNRMKPRASKTTGGGTVKRNSFQIPRVTIDEEGGMETEITK